MLKGTLCSGEKPQQFVLWFWTKVAQQTVFHVCAVLAWLSFLLSVCVWMFFPYFVHVCVVKFSFIRCTFWSVPS